MKAVLVIDIEKDIDIKTLRADFEVYGDMRIKPYYQYRKGVELKPMPKNKDADVLAEFTVTRIFNTGWNACLDAITGETE